MKVPIKKYQSNAFIYLDGKIPSGTFYIVKSGQINITRRNKLLGDVEEIKTTGYIFGIIQAITGMVEEESVKAVTDCEIFVVNRDDIPELYTNHPSVIMKIISEYSEILRKLDDDLVKYDIFFTNNKRCDSVLEFAEKYIKIGQPDKAARLLNSYINEPDISSENLDKSKKLLAGLPEIKYEPDLSSNIMQYKRIRKGTIIFTEYELGNNMFIIKKGKIRITKIKNDKEILLAVLNEGSIFGEMSIFNDKPRNATAVAVEDTDIMVVNENGLSKLPPEIFVSTLKNLTKRIWFVQQQLMAYKFPFPVARLYYFLYAKLKQKFPGVEEDMFRTCLVDISLKDLFLMTDIDETRKDEIKDFLNDDNLDFLDDSIKIKNVKKLIDKNSYYFSRLDGNNLN